MKRDMNITDKNIEALLFDYAEGDLPKEQRAQVERYLADHPACIELLESYKEGICLADAPKKVFEAKDELVKIATSKPKRRSVILASRKVWYFSAAAVALIFAVVFAFRLTNEAEKTPAPALTAQVSNSEKETLAVRETESETEPVQRMFVQKKTAIHLNETVKENCRATSSQNVKLDNAESLVENTVDEADKASENTIVKTDFKSENEAAGLMAEQSSETPAQTSKPKKRTVRIFDQTDRQASQNRTIIDDLADAPSKVKQKVNEGVRNIAEKGLSVLGKASQYLARGENRSRNPNREELITKRKIKHKESES